MDSGLLAALGPGMTPLRKSSSSCAPHNGNGFRISRILLEPNASSSVISTAGLCRLHSFIQFAPSDPAKATKDTIMIITGAHLTPWVAIIAGILILIMPRLLNYIVAIYLIFIGLVGLNGVHHFINWH
jgi:Protein of unknown function (DUF3096)